MKENIKNLFKIVQVVQHAGVNTAHCLDALSGDHNEEENSDGDYDSQGGFKVAMVMMAGKTIL